MYSLTLTQDERAAFDWVGGRYATGNNVSSILCEYLKEDQEWGQEGDITFEIPEHAAWKIRDLCEEEEMLFPCFGDNLVLKMTGFCSEIV